MHLENPSNSLSANKARLGWIKAPNVGGRQQERGKGHHGVRERNSSEEFSVAVLDKTDSNLLAEVPLVPIENGEISRGSYRPSITPSQSSLFGSSQEFEDFSGGLSGPLNAYYVQIYIPTNSTVADDATSSFIRIYATQDSRRPSVEGHRHNWQAAILS